MRVLSNKSEVFDIDERHAWYWVQHKYDVMLVVRTSDEHIRWMNITKAIKRNSVSGVFPKHIPFTGETFDTKELIQFSNYFIADLNSA